jgi:HEPN domain-containing protein
MADPSSNDLKVLAKMRLKDAVLLHNNGQASGAYYLAGYAVECGLKAIIAQSFRSGVIPDKNFINKIYTHNLKELVGLAGLRQELDAETRSSVIFAAHWAIASQWTETSRYDIIDPFQVKDMIQAVSDEKEGVLRWLKTHW